MAQHTLSEQAAIAVLLKAVGDHQVWHYFSREPGESADIDDSRHRLVTVPMRRLQRAGLVQLTRREPGSPRRKLWILTDLGRETADRGI